MDEDSIDNQKIPENDAVGYISTSSKVKQEMDTGNAKEISSFTNISLGTGEHGEGLLSFPTREVTDEYDKNSSNRDERQPADNHRNDCQLEISQLFAKPVQFTQIKIETDTGGYERLKSDRDFIGCENSDALLKDQLTEEKYQETEVPVGINGSSTGKSGDQPTEKEREKFTKLLEEILSVWLNNTVTQPDPPSDEQILAQAKIFGASLCINYENWFSFSHDWLENFKRRWNFTRKVSTTTEPSLEMDTSLDMECTKEPDYHLEKPSSISPIISDQGEGMNTLAEICTKIINNQELKDNQSATETGKDNGEEECELDCEEKDSIYCPITGLPLYGEDDDLLAYINRPKPKRARVGLTPAEKKAICLFKKDNPKISTRKIVEQIKQKFKKRVGRSTLHDVLKQSDKWLNMPNASNEYTRETKGRQPQLEEILGKWLTSAKQRYGKVPEKVIVTKAMKIGEALGIPSNSFAYSSGWLSRFKRRYHQQKLENTVPPDLKEHSGTNEPEERTKPSSAGIACNAGSVLDSKAAICNAENLNWEQKKDICEYRIRYPQLSHKQIAEHFSQIFQKKFREETLKCVLKEADLWLDVELPAKRKQKQISRFQDLEKALGIWVRTAKQRKIPLCDETVIRQAHVFGSKLNIEDTEFGYTKGWLKEFKKSNGFKFAGDADINSYDDHQTPESDSECTDTKDTTSGSDLEASPVVKQGVSATSVRNNTEETVSLTKENIVSGTKANGTDNNQESSCSSQNMTVSQMMALLPPELTEFRPEEDFPKEENKRQRNSLTPAQKKQICIYRKENPQCTTHIIRKFCQEQFGKTIGRSTLLEIFKHADKWISLENPADKVIRERQGKFPLLEEILANYVNEAKSHGMHVSDQKLVEKAKALGHGIGINVEKFAFSSGWINRFKKRYGFLNPRKPKFNQDGTPVEKKPCKRKLKTTTSTGSQEESPQDNDEPWPDSLDNHQQTINADLQSSAKTHEILREKDGGDMKSINSNAEVNNSAANLQSSVNATAFPSLPLPSNHMGLQHTLGISADFTSWPKKNRFANAMSHGPPVFPQMSLSSGGNNTAQNTTPADTPDSGALYTGGRFTGYGSPLLYNQQTQDGEEEEEGEIQYWHFKVKDKKPRFERDMHGTRVDGIISYVGGNNSEIKNERFFYKLMGEDNRLSHLCTNLARYTNWNEEVVSMGMGHVTVELYNLVDEANQGMREYIIRTQEQWEYVLEEAAGHSQMNIKVKLIHDPQQWKYELTAPRLGKLTSVPSDHQRPSPVAGGDRSREISPATKYSLPEIPIHGDTHIQLLISGLRELGGSVPLSKTVFQCGLCGMQVPTPDNLPWNAAISYFHREHFHHCQINMHSNVIGT